MKYLKLSEIADIQSGLVLSRKEAKNTDETMATYKRLNLRSFDEDGRIDVLSLDVFNSTEELNPPIITEKNDIVMRMFSPLCPAVISEETIGLVVPSQLSTIKIKTEQVLPEYLRYYLSQKNTVNKMIFEESWQTQRTVKVSTLANLVVPILSIEKQELIIKILKTHTKRKQLYKELIEKEDLYVNGLMKKIIGGTQK